MTRRGLLKCVPRPGGDSMPTIEPKPIIDTSKMSPAQREALELTEAAREAAQAVHQ